MSIAQARSHDLPVLVFLWVPAGIVAAVLYAVGGWQVALAVGVVAFVVGALISPEVGFYGYFAWQALDPITIREADTILTPGKLLGVFLIVNYIVGIWRQRTPMLVSRRFVVVMVVFALFGMIHLPVAVQPMFVLRYAAQIILQALLIVVAIHTFRDRTTLGRALFFTVAGGVMASILLFLAGAQPGMFRRATLGTYANPNSTAYALSVAMICIPAAWAVHRNKWIRPLYLLAAPLIVAATMQTGSRAALGAILFAFACAGVLARGAGLLRRLAIPVVCVVVAVASGVYVLRSSMLNPVSQERIESLGRSGALHGESRLYIWGLALRTYAHEPWGFGFGNTQFKLAAKHGVQLDAHSSYLSALLDGGPIGLALFLYAFWLLVQRVRSIRRAQLSIPAAMLLCFVAFLGLTHTIHFAKWFWIPVMFCLLLAELAERERRAENGFQEGLEPLGSNRTTLTPFVRRALP